MASKKTHTGIVIRKDGRKRVQLHQTATVWIAKANEFYYRESGIRVGAPGRGRLELDSIRPIEEAGGNDG